MIGFPPVSSVQVLIVLAVGHDNIPALFLNSAAAIIAPYLQGFINLSFTHGTFPDNCTVYVQLVKVIPLHKTGNKPDSNNRSTTIFMCFHRWAQVR